MFIIEKQDNEEQKEKFHHSEITTVDILVWIPSKLFFLSISILDIQL